MSQLTKDALFFKHIFLLTTVEAGGALFLWSVADVLVIRLGRLVQSYESINMIEQSEVNNDSIDQSDGSILARLTNKRSALTWSSRP